MKDKPAARENISVFESKTDEDNAEKKTMDMIKEELANEMKDEDGGEAGGADGAEAAGGEAPEKQDSLSAA